ncbi:MAG: 7-cyano-7-deazaguanine synthase QueC, partial [Planctomycetota bacterium]|nr:7-cyano-7-deazaguanine synthase QueC [Planctomycetota bacterium]
MPESLNAIPDKLGESALVCLSGGQDSTTCLYWAKSHFSKIECIAFDYGQRHKIELDAAKDVATMAGSTLTVLPISALSALGGNSLTDSEIQVERECAEGELPNSFVPGRNLLFLTLAAAAAYQRGIKDLVTGVCQTDFSGYPDCRRDTMDSLEKTISLGMAMPIRIHTPLMWLTKAQTVHLAQDLHGCMDAMVKSHTCYEGQRPPCGECPACQLRAKGFAEAGFPDPVL